MEPSHVLVPLDGSPLADDALALALATFDCRVTVLNVVTPADARMSEGPLLEPDETRHRAARQRATELIESARERADAADRTIETAVRTGEPSAEILAVVADSSVDHVVMGSHSGDRGRLARRLLGTVTTAVVGESPVTVTVVR